MKKPCSCGRTEIHDAKDCKSQPFNTVPSEMHERMVQERDKKIAELQKALQFKQGYVDDCLRAIKDPQPAREGWLKPTLGICMYGLITFCTGMIIWTYLRTPAAPKGMGEEQYWHRKCQMAYLILRDERDAKGAEEAYQTLNQ